MRRTVLMCALLIAQTVIGGETAGIAGTVTFEGEVLPGATVRLTSYSLVARTTTDAAGRYAFDALAPGTYHLTYELEGLESVEKRVTVSGGTEEVSASLTLDPSKFVVLSCGSLPCVERPENEWDLPACTDFDLDTALIEALGRDDASARDLLRHHFETTFTYDERHRIASALLRRVDDDSRYWKELERHASIAVRFPQIDSDWTPELTAWCAERNLDPDDYWPMALNALTNAREDPRARPLLLRALETDDPSLIMTGVWGLALQRDESALPAIEAVLKRKHEEDSSLVIALSAFMSTAADEIAMKYLDESDREYYGEQRALAATLVTDR